MLQLAKGGRQILIAAVGKTVPFNILEFYRGRHTYVGIDTLAFSSVESGELLRGVLHGFGAGKLKPFPISGRSVYSLAEAKSRLHRRDRVVPRPYRAALGRLSSCMSFASPTRRPTPLPDISTCRWCAFRAERPVRSDDLWMGVSVIAPGGRDNAVGLAAGRRCTSRSRASSIFRTARRKCRRKMGSLPDSRRGEPPTGQPDLRGDRRSVIVLLPADERE